MEELQQFLKRNKARFFNIKNSANQRVAYVEDTPTDEILEAFREEYENLEEGKYILGCWKVNNGSKAILNKPFTVGEMSFVSSSNFKPTNMKSNTLQEMIAQAKEEARREALLEMRIEKIQDFINDEIKPILKTLKELADLDVKALREGIEALKNDDEDDDEDAISKLEKFEKGVSIFKSMTKSA
jgi:uncharacterized protein (UPF0335 family)